MTCVGRAGPAVRDGGASASIACAFVPPKPNELTPMRLGVPLAFQPVVAVATWNGPRSKSMSGLGSRKFRLGTSSPCRSCNTALTNDATPAALSRCPMLDFTELSRTGASRSAPSPNTLASAATSIGSPSWVAVPCASTAPTVSGDTPATASAAAITLAWPATLGAV
jgi:hypothetical protein